MHSKPTVFFFLILALGLVDWTRGQKKDLSSGLCEQASKVVRARIASCSTEVYCAPMKALAESIPEGAMCSGKGSEALRDSVLKLGGCFMKQDVNCAMSVLTDIKNKMADSKGAAVTVPPSAS